MCRFYNHNGIVHNNPNSQDKCKQCEQVDRKSKKLHEKECTDNRYRYRNGWYKGRPEILQENEYHQKYEEKGFQQCLLHLGDGCIQEIFCTEYGKCMDSFWKFSGSLFHYFFSCNQNLISIGPGSLKNTNARSGITLNQSIGTVRKSSQFH